MDIARAGHISVGERIEEFGRGSRTWRSADRGKALVSNALYRVIVRMPALAAQLSGKSLPRPPADMGGGNTFYHSHSGSGIHGLASSGGGSSIAGFSGGGGSLYDSGSMGMGDSGSAAMAGYPGSSGAPTSGMMTLSPSMLRVSPMLGAEVGLRNASVVVSVDAPQVGRARHGRHVARLEHLRVGSSVGVGGQLFLIHAL